MIEWKKWIDATYEKKTKAKYETPRDRVLICVDIEQDLRDSGNQQENMSKTCEQTYELVNKLNMAKTKQCERNHYAPALPNA